MNNIATHASHVKKILNSKINTKENQKGKTNIGFILKLKGVQI